MPPEAIVSQRVLFGPEIDRGLELIPAGLAGPQMPDATLVDMLRPFRCQQSVATLCAGSEVAGSGLYRRSRAEPHGRKPPSYLPPSKQHRTRFLWHWHDLW